MLQGTITCRSIQGFPTRVSLPLWGHWLSRSRLPRSPVSAPTGPTLGSLFWAQGPGGCWSAFGGLADRGACVLSSCSFPASLVMNGQHMSGEEECIWGERCDFQEAVFWQQVAEMAGGPTVLSQRGQPMEKRCRHAQFLVFDPELTRVTFKSCWEGTSNNWTRRNLRIMMKNHENAGRINIC